MEDGLPALPLGLHLALAGSVAAQAPLVPLLALQFHRVAPVALVLNLAAVPLATGVLLAGAAAVAASAAWPALGAIAGYVAWGLAHALLLSGEVVLVALLGASLALFLSTLAFVLTARMIVRRRYGPWQWLSLAVTLGALQLVRSVGLWTVGVVVLTLVATGIAEPSQRRAIGNGLAVGATAAILLALPWYIHLQSTTGSVVFGRQTTAIPLSDRWPGAFYISPGLPDVISEPHRGALPPRFLPILYTDTWGDYFGIWSWNPPRPELTPTVNRRLVVQSIVGLPLTAVALAGWFALVGLALVRARESPARLMVVLMPLVSLAGALYYAVQAPSADGDTVKAMFLLTAVPAWAISFGFAADTLLARHRRIALAAFTVLALCAFVALRFATYASVS